MVTNVKNIIDKLKNIKLAKTELIKAHKKASEGAQAKKLASIKAYRVLKETSSSEIKGFKDIEASLRDEL